MAKKQSINYGPDSNLIQGAATAYRNYDNAPGMYSGLDKVIKTGTEIGLKAIADKKTADDKAVIDAETALAAEKQKKKDQDNAWYKAAGDTYNAAGSFMKVDGPELTDTIALLDALQPEYTKAMESGTAAEKAAVNARYQAIKTSVDGHKQLRADISDDLIGASDANFNTGTLGGDDGRFGDFLTGLLKEDYKITYETDDNGLKQKMYTVGDASYSLEQINEKTVRKNRKPAVDYYDARTKISKKKTYDEAETRMVVKNIVPQGYNEMRDFMRGDYFDTGNFASLLEKDRERLKLEIGAQFDLDNKNGIDDKEFDNFISAATDPYHEMWNKDGKVDKQGWEDSSRAIAEDLLVNGIKNKHALKNPEDPIWKQKGYANEGAYLKAQGGNDEGGKTDTNPYGLPKDGLRLGDPMPNGYQIEVRQDLVTGYINDIKAGGDFKFLQNDYSFVDGNWYENYGTKPNEDGQGGAFKYDNTQAMVDDVFQTGGKYFDGLETKIQINPETGEAFNAKAKKSKVKPLELSALGNAKSTRDVFDEIQAAYKTKNEAIKTATGSIGGLLARKSGQSIYITIDGVEKEFSLGGAGGFGGTSVNTDKRMDYLTNLELLLNTVNSSLNPEYVNTDYNSTNTN